MSNAKNANTNDPIPSLKLENTVNEILQHLANNSNDDAAKLCVNNFYHKLPSNTFNDATLKLKAKLEERSVNEKNVDVSIIIQYIETKYMSKLIEITAKLLIQMESENDRTKDIIEKYFEKCLSFFSKASEKLIDELKKQSAALENMNISSIIQKVQNGHQTILIDVTAKYLISDIKPMKRTCNRYFKNSFSLSKQDAINELISKIHGMSPSSSIIIQHILSQVVDDTVIKIKIYGEQGSFKGVLNCIQAFCQRNYKTIKHSAPLLILKCFHLFNKTKNEEFSTYAIKQILQNSEIILNNPILANKIFKLEIPKSLWIETFKKVSHFSIKNCESAIDMLLFNGTLKDAQNEAGIVANLYYNNSIDEIFAVISEFCSKHPEKFLRTGIMGLICTIFTLLSNTNDLQPILEQILSSFMTFVTQKCSKDNVFHGTVPSYLWEKCLLIILQLNPTKCFEAIDLIVHVSKPDTPKRNEYILQTLKGLNKNEKLKWEQILHCVQKMSKIDLRSDAMSRICELNLTEKDSYSMLEICFNHEKLKDDKEIVFGKVSDDLWINALKKFFELLPFFKMTTWKPYSSTFDLLFHIRNPESEKRKLKIYEIIRSLLYDSSTFDIGIACVKTFELKMLQENEFENMIKISKSFNKETVLYKYFPKTSRVSRKQFIAPVYTLSNQLAKLIEMFKKLKNHDKNESAGTDNSSLEKNFSQLNTMEYDNFIVKDITLWEKHYKYLYVDNPKALYNFLVDYLLPFDDDVGLDTETDINQNIVLLQLGTHAETFNWACIIDVQTLLTQISEEQWKIFFEKLFEKKLTAFSYHNDRNYLCNTFPYLQEIFQIAKVECMQKFTAKLCKEIPMFKNKIFDDTFVPGSGLKAHAKVFCNIDLDKSQQKSDWTQRPLTDEQDNYAIRDGVVPVSIKKKLQERIELLLNMTMIYLHNRCFMVYFLLKSFIDTIKNF